MTWDAGDDYNGPLVPLDAAATSTGFGRDHPDDPVRVVVGLHLQFKTPPAATPAEVAAAGGPPTMHIGMAIDEAETIGRMLLDAVASARASQQ